MPPCQCINYSLKSIYCQSKGLWNLQLSLASDTVSSSAMSDTQKNTWEKISRAIGLYRYIPNGRYFARVRYRGKLHRKSLETSDCALAKRRLAEFRRTLERTDATSGNKSFAAVLDEYRATLIGAKSTVEDKSVIIDKIKSTLLGAETLPLRELRASQIKTWLATHYGHKSASYYNSALMLVRDALEAAVRDRVIAENPARDLKYRKRKTPIRLTPTFDQFKQIVAEIRAQKFNQVAEQSGDFIEFLGLAGLGAAEAASLTPADVDLGAGHIIAYRHKTNAGFAVPIYPQLRPLLKKLCAGKAHNERLFQINEARKALTNACVRLRLAHFTHRSLRRMFITRAIELGVDVKTIAQWQGHRDGGLLILKAYSHVRPVHSQRMAQLLR
jgi:Site-specific recombinase XerD